MYMKRVIIVFISLLIHYTSFAVNNLKIDLDGVPDVNITLYGFQGFSTFKFDEGKTDENGTLKLTFDKDYKGAGFIDVDGQNQLLLILAEENIKITFNDIFNNFEVTFDSRENIEFENYIQERSITDAKLSGLKYVLPYYEESSSKRSLRFINNEIKNLKERQAKNLENLDKSLYVSYYIPIRTYVENIPVTINRYWHRVEQDLLYFHEIDFSDKRLLHSGILERLMENYVVLCESAGSGTPDLDSVYVLINAATDHLLATVEGEDDLLNLYANHLFNLFEKRSLFRAAEYLSNQMLDGACELESGLERKMQQYRAMKKGNPAPDVNFSSPVRGYESLHEIPGDYRLIVFWASWCNHCMEEIPSLYNMNSLLSENGVKVVSFPLEYDKESYNQVSSHFSDWLHYSDFKGWESESAELYYVFATPTIYLVDSEDNIYWRFNSVSHLESFLQNNMLKK
ncbi:MAG: TlpA family protein disulfide reductase [Chitinophagaceae bacterium]|nr:MAG: TlpA family protein disulfide reductase [Chitinophagaceae bacterium]